MIIPINLNLRDYYNNSIFPYIYIIIVSSSLISYPFNLPYIPSILYNIIHIHFSISLILLCFSGSKITFHVPIFTSIGFAYCPSLKQNKYKDLQDFIEYLKNELPKTQTNNNDLIEQFQWEKYRQSLILLNAINEDFAIHILFPIQCASFNYNYY